MELAFAEITQAKTFYTLSEIPWLPEDEKPSIQSVQAEIWVRKKTNTTVLLRGVLQFIAQLACDRCGVPVERPLKEEFEYTLTLEEQSSAELSELECSDEDCNIVHLKQPVIDVDALVREQFLLAVPLKTLCAEDCRGLCSVCGALLKTESCSCLSGSSNSPFAVLERLQKA